jgi:hypothetical protein
MAERKGPKEVPPQGRQSDKEMSEKSPNPHGENKILQMPIKSHQRHETGGKNIPQVPNTIGGNLNPSVAHEFRNRALNDKSEKSVSDKRTGAPRPVTQIKRKDA